MDNPLVQLLAMLLAFGICVVMAPRIKRRYGMPIGSTAPRERVSHPTPQTTPHAPTDTPIMLHYLPVKERKNVIIAGAPGDGKTQTSIALLCVDIAQGAQVYWLNPHLALYHPEDQTTDLRPLAEQFTAVPEYDRIAAVLKAADALIDTRMPLYRAGEDVGHHIVLYIDEAPAIFEVCGDAFIKPLRSILREGRKCRVWVCFATQDAQVKTMGLESGLRNNFHTRLAGNVEQATWQALIGVGVPKPGQRLARGFWHCQGEHNGIAQVVLPKAHDIAYIASQPMPRFAPLTDETPDAARLIESVKHSEIANELDEMCRWLEESPDLSGRAAARKLYQLRGGDDPGYSGDGPLYYEAATLLKRAKGVV